MHILMLKNTNNMHRKYKVLLHDFTINFFFRLFIDNLNFRLLG